MTVKRVPRCATCGNRIDPFYCHCGMTEEDHWPTTGHGFVPNGCTCGYEKPTPKPRRIERGYSEHVTERLDPQRPKYSEAVKSIAAFCDKVMTDPKTVFEVLVSHLDDAVAEAVVRGRMMPHPGRLGRVIRLKP
jgi:hypothetical protein